jgi:UDP-N-acetylglucosamine 2-epimerase (non-hydrolysing)
MKKIMTVFGTRPESIKMAPIIQQLNGHPSFHTNICVTGQHKEMLDQALKPFGIEPHINLKVMSANQTLTDVSAKIIRRLGQIVQKNKPHMIMVQGDTTTAFCGAFVGFTNRIPVAHVEAGLRTGNPKVPFPEEANRRLIAPLADLHFAPTEQSREALLREWVSLSQIEVTGNTVIDALLMIRKRVSASLPDGISRELADQLHNKDVVLVTGHRRENFGSQFEDICRAILNVAERNPQCLFVYPVHLNPNVQEPVKRILRHPRILLLNPLSYEAFVWMLDHSSIILTDSGGVQEEAPSLGKPVLVMRDTTERMEGVIAGNARLVGTQKESIEINLQELLSSPSAREKMASVANPYGDGHASERIIHKMESYFNITRKSETVAS